MFRISPDVYLVRFTDRHGYARDVDVAAYDRDEAVAAVRRLNPGCKIVAVLTPSCVEAR